MSARVRVVGYGFPENWVHVLWPDTQREEIHAGDLLDCPVCWPTTTKETGDVS